MTVGEIHKLITTWAPKEIAWERDNIGLQVGDLNAAVTGILVCLDVTEKIVREASKRNANLIISHHPLLFQPPKSITPHDGVGRCIRALIANNINLYSAHTNLDFTRGGTSFAIAEALDLRNVDFLHATYRIRKKIVTFVPEQHMSSVRDAMARAGAGIIGNYDHCSFGTIGEGSFRGSESTSPAIGTKGKLEHVPEVRLEMVMNQWDVINVVSALRSAHPYEEVAYDIYPLENTSGEYGMGILGTLKRPLRLKAFLELVKTRLHARMLRRTESTIATIRTVAACGGSGAELADVAMARGADAFITADVKYHDFQHAHRRMLLVDAGHYETEHLVVHAVVRKLKTEFATMGTPLPIAATRILTNPVLYS